jgi:hypothetical protein
MGCARLPYEGQALPEGLLCAVARDPQAVPSLSPMPVPLALLLVIPLATRIPSLLGEVG